MIMVYTWGSSLRSNLTGPSVSWASVMMQRDNSLTTASSLHWKLGAFRLMMIDVAGCSWEYTIFSFRLYIRKSAANVVGPVSASIQTSPKVPSLAVWEDSLLSEYLKLSAANLRNFQFCFTPSHLLKVSSGHSQGSAEQGLTCLRPKQLTYYIPFRHLVIVEPVIFHRF